MPDATHAGGFPAPAKLNLFLHVTGRRPDGYHLLDSLVAFTDYGDTVQAAPSDTLSLELSGGFAGGLSAEPDNLVLRAARLLAEAAGVPAQAALHLTKRLPIAAGIGGGSADAAATLRALAALWRIDLPTGELAKLALSLGADVPACLLGQPCRMTGIGETLTPLPALPALPVLLVNPGLPLSTPAVFKARQPGFSAPAPAAIPDTTSELIAFLHAQRNDLTAAATGLLPDIADILAILPGLPGCLLSRMSGSGPTCFALMQDGESAAAAARSLARSHPGWWVVPTSLRRL
ncbi:MAG: 4-(cytidine 5'-diphospho)-2-C-methyl-D-erythritol kinase [Alphaproteobacteria bacterium]|nr:4-(cytidine 5'-diphospho)-2-C-methyl-D-erythritol kinase [Alphaproteobacteria bacterium]MBU0798878.1 4-(cytidine 5'-diphospho)-2-C-methyl-D-erythritol kinase [Alphaproteobacteria bacterium]MBU0888728.1 4-(cytidine 5'-diphospho)-2-C-methyl-D-erythritol kinase [Alphaproteobacteria bacterium]MBU1813538.1 4-(cytidine 5'-diphospho)-2-C-methyl-D-erythritol kinase [Alphaproteobacteria bacterium]